MTTAQEFARFAVELSQQAEQIKPAPGEPFEVTRKLIQYHLITAASQTRSIAEALAKVEGLPK